MVFDWLYQDRGSVGIADDEEFARVIKEAGNAELTRHLDEVAQTIIEAAVHRDLTEAPEVEEPKRLSRAITRGT